MKTRSTVCKFLVIAACFLGGFVSQAVAQNLLTNNPGFEEGAEGWQQIDGTYWRLSKNAAPWGGGEHSLQRLGFKGSKKGQRWSRYNKQNIPVSAGEEYVLQAAMAGSGGGTGSWTLLPVLQVYDAQGHKLAVLEGAKYSRANASGGYARPSAILKMPAGAAAVQVGVRVDIDEDLSDIAYLHFDNILLTKAAAGAEQ